LRARVESAYHGQANEGDRKEEGQRQKEATGEKNIPCFQRKALVAGPERNAENRLGLGRRRRAGSRGELFGGRGGTRVGGTVEKKDQTILLAPLCPNTSGGKEDARKRGGRKSLWAVQLPRKGGTAGGETLPGGMEAERTARVLGEKGVGPSFT